MFWRALLLRWRMVENAAAIVIGNSVFEQTFWGGVYSGVVPAHLDWTTLAFASIIAPVAAPFKRILYPLVVLFVVGAVGTGSMQHGAT
jgi:hypothetical protein